MYKRAAQDLLSESGTFSLSLYTAFRVLIIVRCFSALYRILDDCDEVYNYWEPTHYLLEGYGRETWEYSTDYKIRSWGYVFVHAVVGLVAKLIAPTKVQVFYLIRLALGAVSSFVEARFYRTITEEINPHVGRYVFTILFFGAGMFNASTGKSSHSTKKRIKLIPKKKKKNSLFTIHFCHVLCVYGIFLCFKACI